VSFRTKAQRETSRQNGKKGGRPPAKTKYRRRLASSARLLGEISLPKVVQLWVNMIDGRVPGATAGERSRAAENIADRFGLPRLNQQQQVGDFPTKLIDLRLPQDRPPEEGGTAPEEEEKNGDEPPPPMQH